MRRCAGFLGGSLERKERRSKDEWDNVKEMPDALKGGIRMKKSQCLIQRLRDELNFKLPADTIAKRTRSGWHQKAAGAWIWFLSSESRFIFPEIGSPFTITELIKSQKLCVVFVNRGSDIEIYPDDIGPDTAITQFPREADND